MDTLTQILGVERERVVDAEWLDNGPGWVGVLLDHADAVLALRPEASPAGGHGLSVWSGPTLLTRTLRMRSGVLHRGRRPAA
ncbi:hypothetical protein [Nesterenkonia pannonica]|uniref:hypothetical protein n=1 Tax=Nesterenkonia pannonica TaxID=1548602 RepID=UPI002164DC93|nr:hypothetical protein [Nesterenkonia pannonica]